MAAYSIKLREEVEALLGGAWEAERVAQSWQFARVLFLIQPFVGQEEAWSRYVSPLYAGLRQREALLSIDAREERRAYAAVVYDRYHAEFSELVGDMTRERIEALEAMLAVQRELSALQWWLEGCPALSEAWLAESIADLSWAEREVGALCDALAKPTQDAKLDRDIAISQATRRATLQLSDEVRGRFLEQSEVLRTQTLSVREEMLGFEARYFLQSSQEQLKSSEEIQKERRAYTGEMPAFSLTEGAGEPFDPEKTEIRISAFAPGLDEKEEADAAQIALRSGLLKDLSSVWYALLEGESLKLSLLRQLARYDGRSGGERVKRSMEDVDQRIQTLRERMAHLMGEVEADVFRRWFPEHLQLVLDHLDEQLSEVDDIPLGEAAAILEVTEARSVWLLNLILPLQESRYRAKTRFDQMVNQTRQIMRRLRAEAQERQVQYRLEKAFTAKRVAQAETLTLILIFSVLGMLVLEMLLPVPHSVKFALMLVDTAICGWFLFEFFTKLSKADRKGLYFRRHFVIDFLPSLPFGLVFWVIQTQSAASHITAGRAARLIRASRIARYIRILRPLIRIFRVTIFLVRAMDRLLRKFEPVFNRNIVIFPRPDEVDAMYGEHEVAEEIQSLRERARKRMRLWLEVTEIGERLPFLQAQLATVHGCLGRFGEQMRVRRWDRALVSAEINIEQLIRNMTTMDAVRAEETLGATFIRNMYRILNYLTASGVRRLPILRKIAAGIAELDPASAVAWVIRRVGRRLERFHNWILWIGDWFGMITGPQVLDRIGLTLINATMRPAKRLLIFGALFVFISGMISAFSIGFLHDIASYLGRFLGIPIIVLGVLSMIPLVLGFWFRMLAGESTDLHSKVFEAQFIGRLKQIKRQRREKDLVTLYQRILAPEDRLRERKALNEDEQRDALLEHLNKIEQADLLPSRALDALPHPTASDGVDHQRTQWLEREQMLLLYEDYIEGTPLHRSDVKTTNQLLGNLLMQNLRRHRLQLSLFENLRIDRLDLSRSKLLLYLGPYLWFTAITESLSQRIAHLIVDFNQFCVPLRELQWCSEKQRERYEAWKARRFALLEGTMFDQQAERDKEGKKERPFLHNEFTALHFLSVQPERDRAIAEIFGEDIMRLMQAERKAIVREIFGYYPFHRWSKEYRTFNPYQFYQRYAASGKIFLMPFLAIWMLLKGIVWGVSSTIRLVRDILRPPMVNVEQQVGWASFQVAIRKINRMRKPIYIEAMRLRCMIDAEYLGFFLPRKTASAIELRGLEADLDFIGASEQEREHFHALRDHEEARLKAFQEMLGVLGWEDEESFIASLAAYSPPLAVRRDEILRAVTSAYLINYKQIASINESYQTLRSVLQETLWEERRQPTSRWGVLRVKMTGVWHRLRVFLNRGRDKEHEHLMRFLSLHAAQCEELARHPERVWDAYLLHRSALKKHLLFWARHVEGSDTVSVLKEKFEEVIRQHRIWSEELLTLRTIQTLTQLDIRLYRELIYALGGYGADRNAVNLFSE
jgi:hypothetical protein